MALQEDTPEEKSITMEDVNERMKSLNITGWSSMGDFTPEEHMKHLDVIEALQQKNFKRARELSGGHGGVTYHPDGRVEHG